MTRRAIERGFERYLADLVEETYEAFDVAAVIRGSRGGGSRVASKLLKQPPAGAPRRPAEAHSVRADHQSTVRDGRRLRGG
ncbi:hypothetical protein [Haloarcula regularis]|uniref:hypothetical protein n=1 Tax=Haloarcula regularis TaxID=3033392 RepID=UPI0023E8AC9B|nr:hypothetical protein [Halomicroarcula sp. SYNS111]